MDSFNVNTVKTNCFQLQTFAGFMRGPTWSCVKLHWPPVTTYLKKSVANKCNEESMTLSLNHSTRILRRVHGREVKHGDVRLPVVVVSKLQVRKLVPRCYGGGFTSVSEQCRLVDVVFWQQQIGVFIILCSRTKCRHLRLDSQMARMLH